MLRVPFFKTVICDTVIFQFFTLNFTLFTSHFLYKVTKCHAKFVGYISGISFHAEVRARVYRSEVGVVGAVVAPCDSKEICGTGI